MSSSPSRRRSRSSRRSRGFSRRLTFGRHAGSTYGEVLRQQPGYVRWALGIPRPQGDLRHFVTWLRRHVDEVDEDEGWEDHDEDEEEDEEEDNEYDLESPDLEIPNLLPGARGNALPADVFFPPWLQMPMPNVFDLLEHAQQPQVPNEEEARAIFQRHRQMLLEQQQRQQQRREQRRGSRNLLTTLIEQLPRVPFSASLFSGQTHQQSCPICMEDFSAWEAGSALEIVITPCFHTFHVGCISGWLGKRHDCPTCRWDIRDSGEQQAMTSSRSGLKRRVPSNLAIEVSDDEG